MSKVRSDLLSEHVCDQADRYGTVLLQAMKEEPAPDAKCKDKFLVQSVAVTRDMEYSNVTSIVC